jgi:crotonobetainyl-CoA:carnitine CoA-transferase CaiB-like acyl-CoA transferase
MMLAEQGAEVIKVEPPGHGDESRQLANYRDGMAGLYLNSNHAKRSIGIDLKTEQGKGLFYDLIRSADVFVQNWRPGTAERLGLGEAELRSIKPDLIYASVVGFGDDGPYASRRGYDPIFQALTGYVAAQLNPEVPIPDLIRNAVVDKATAYTLAQAITAALLARERGAPGQHVRVTMLDAGLAFFWPDGMLRHSLVGDDVENLMVPGERYAGCSISRFPWPRSCPIRKSWRTLSSRITERSSKLNIRSTVATDGFDQPHAFRKPGSNRLLVRHSTRRMRMRF